MARTKIDRLKDIVLNIEKIEGLLQDLDFDRYEDLVEHDQTFFDALCRDFQNIGEAVNDLPKDFTNLHSQVDWRGFVNLRNVLVHQYFGIKIEALWESFEDNELRQLFEVVSKEIERLESENSSDS